MSKKIILFIVEGDTDKNSLGYIMEELISRNQQIEVEFEVVNGDITSKYEVEPTNIAKKITELIKNNMSKYYNRKSDYKEVVHIIDLDGVNLDDMRIETSEDVNNIKYSNDKILCQNRDKIIQRNQRKKRNIEKLISLNYVYKNIPYRVFFMSKDLEHVLHDKLKVDYEDKLILANDFQDKFDDDIDQFYYFITSSISSRKDYRESWDYVFQIQDQIPRLTNLDILVKDYY